MARRSSANSLLATDHAGQLTTDTIYPNAPNHRKMKNFLDCHWFKKLLFSTSCFGQFVNGQFVSDDLVLINRAGGLYGRILTKVVSTDRTQ